MNKQKDIKEFLNPKTIAVIGASSTPNKVGNILMEKLKKFKGKVIPINNQIPIISKRLAYKTVLHYSKSIDLAIIAIPAKFVPKILKQCAKKQIKNIIIISAGFSEVKNFKLEKKIIKLKEKYKLNILGPNCFGIFNPKLNLDATFSNITPRKGNIAFISQSGALWSYIADMNIGFSGFVSLGNMSDLNFADFIEYFNKDRSTKKIILYIEKVKQGKRFIEACKNSKKEILVIKAGKTQQGIKATISHTASLATNFEIYKGAFTQAKIKLKESLAQALKLPKQNFHSKLKGKRTLIITNAGGAGALLIDKLNQTKSKPNKLIDLLGTAKANDYRKALERIQKDYENILVVLTPQTMSEPEETAHIISNSIHKNKIIALFLGEKSIKKAVEILKQNKVPVFTRVI